MIGMRQSLYSRLIKSDDEALSAMPAAARKEVPGNALRLIGAHSLQSTGDQIVNPSTVLPWLLTSLGAPAWIIALLLPVRESGSMLPQAALTPWVLRSRYRKWIWVAGGAGQAVAVAAMAMTAAIGNGTAAGIAILVELVAFALSRSLCSIASKDVQGRTMPKGQRGQINGISALVSGIVAVTVGLTIRIAGGTEVNTDILAGLLGISALIWVGALIVYASVCEPAGEPHTQDGTQGWLARSWQLLTSDRAFRRFVIVRSLLLVSSLSPPFIVIIASAEGASGLSGLGPFLIASGLAGIVGGRLSGRLADRSSRRVMIWGSGMSSLVIVLVIGVAAAPGFDGGTWLFPLAFFSLALTHLAVRVARKTYVVDMAEGDQRTEYVAVSNTAMGVLLLVAGGVSSALAHFGTDAALLFLALLGVLGVFVGRSLPEVSHGATS